MTGLPGSHLKSYDGHVRTQFKIARVTVWVGVYEYAAVTAAFS